MGICMVVVVDYVKEVPGVQIRHAWRRPPANEPSELEKIGQG